MHAVRPEPNIYKDWVNIVTGHLSQRKNYTSNFALFNNEQFKHLFRNAPVIVLVVNHIEHRYEFFSENVKNILGYDAEEYYHGSLEFGISKLYPEHAHVLSSYLFPLMFDTFEKYKKSGDVRNLRMSYNFKYKRKDGEYIWVSQQMSVLETDSEGNPLLTVYFMSDISHMKKDEQIDIAISLRDDSCCFKPVLISNYPAGHVIDLSRREIEILELISKGNSSKKAASLLGISEHTVRTHRKNMLHKTGAGNITELLRLAMVKGLIS